MPAEDRVLTALQRYEPNSRSFIEAEQARRFETASLQR